MVDSSVVEWDDDGSNVRSLAGLNAIHNEAARKELLLFNDFWAVQHFRVHQMMLLRDGMHAIALGAILRLIMVIHLKYLEFVKTILDMEGLAAYRLEARMRQCLARQAGPDGQT